MTGADLSARTSRQTQGPTTSRHVSRPPAAVLGLSGSAMGVLASLERLGVDAYGVYSDRSSAVAQHSRRLRARYHVLDGGSFEQVQRALRSIRAHAGSSTVVLLPTDDTFARLVSTRRAELEGDFLFRVPPLAIGETFLDKRDTVDLCRRHRMPIPRSTVPHTLEDVERAARGLRYPVIIKPARTDDEGFPGKNVVVSSASKLIGFYRQQSDLIPRSMFQELTPSGDGHIATVNSYSNLDGSVVAQLSCRRLRQWLPDVGSATFSVTETHPRLLQATRSFLDDIGYVGFSQAEFAEDTHTGEWHFLELNCRIVYSNRQYADAGVDLTAIGYREMIGEELHHGRTQEDGVYWVDLHRDIPAFVLKRLRGQIGLREWSSSLRSVSSFAIYDPTDGRPFVASIARMLAMGLGLASGRQIRATWSAARLPGGLTRAAWDALARRWPRPGRRGQ